MNTSWSLVVSSDWMHLPVDEIMGSVKYSPVCLGDWLSGYSTVTIYNLLRKTADLSRNDCSCFRICPLILLDVLSFISSLGCIVWLDVCADEERVGETRRLRLPQFITDFCLSWDHPSLYYIFSLWLHLKCFYIGQLLTCLLHSQFIGGLRFLHMTLC